MQIALAYIPCKNKDEAKKIAKTCLEESLAVCANILPSYESLYFWEGELKEETESLLLLKHKMSDFPLLRKKIRELHSYDVPCITQIHLNNTNQEFLNWVEEQKKEA